MTTRPVGQLDITASQVALLGTMSDPDAARELGTTSAGPAFVRPGTPQRR